MSRSTDSIVLLDHEQRPAGVLAWHPFANVLRLTSTGEVVWRCALLPHETTAKCWLGMEWTGSLRVSTYSYNCELDPMTGTIAHTEFTK